MKSDPEEKEQRIALGRRMEEAARELGLEPKDIALRMNQKEQAGGIYRWWRGDRAPSGLNLVEYADIVGKSVEWLVKGNEDAVVQKEVLDTLHAIMDESATGQRLDRAFKRAWGADSLTKEEAKQLADFSANVPDLLTRLAGEAWEQLSEEDQRQVLVRMIKIVRGAE